MSNCTGTYGSFNGFAFFYYSNKPFGPASLNSRASRVPELSGRFMSFTAVWRDYENESPKLKGLVGSKFRWKEEIFQDILGKNV